MNIYCVYTDTRKKDNKPMIVEQSSSLMAGIFGILWVLYHRMWSYALILLVISYIMSYFKENDLYYCYDITIFFLMTFFAGDIREKYLRTKGYHLNEVIAARDIEEAEMRYLSKMKEISL